MVQSSFILYLNKNIKIMKNLVHKLIDALIYIVLGILAISYSLCIIGIMAGYNNIFEMFQ